MGEFAFARSFNILQHEKWHHAILMLRRAMSLLGPLSPVPWLAQIGFSLIPNYWVVKDWNSMMRWCKTRMDERIKVSQPAYNEIFHDASLVPQATYGLCLFSRRSLTKIDATRKNRYLLVSHRSITKRKLDRREQEVVEW